MAFQPVIGHGIFTNSGAAWERSRQLLRPAFSKPQTPDLNVLETHVRNLMRALAPSDGRQVDLQKYFVLLMTDVSTQFVLGSGTSCLAGAETGDEAASELSRAIDKVHAVIHRKMQLGSAARLLPTGSYEQCKKFLHGFVEEHVRRELSVHASQEKKDHVDGDVGGSFLRHLVSQTTDSHTLRDEMLCLLSAGRDSTASALSHLFFELARNPRAWKRLQEEVKSLGGKKPTHGDIKDLSYLRNSIYEGRLGHMSGKYLDA
jgi:cytochrome P450